MAIERMKITAEEASADPTNVVEVRVHGDAPIARVVVHGEGRNEWLYIEYANGGSSAGTPKAWPSFVRLVEIEGESPEQSDEDVALGVYVSAGYESSDFEDAFCGWWDSEADYARDLAEDLGRVREGWPYSCIDWNFAWRELRIGGDNWSEYVPGHGYAIFREV